MTTRSIIVAKSQRRTDRRVQVGGQCNRLVECGGLGYHLSVGSQQVRVKPTNEEEFLGLRVEATRSGDGTKTDHVLEKCFLTLLNSCQLLL